MDYKYELTESVVEDIDNTFNYIVNVLNNRNAAVELVIEIEKTIEKICSFPFSYSNCKYYHIEDETIRHANISNYDLIYKIIQNRIIFLRFKYSKKEKLL